MFQRIVKSVQSIKTKYSFQIYYFRHEINLRESHFLKMFKTEAYKLFEKDTSRFLQIGQTMAYLQTGGTIKFSAHKVFMHGSLYLLFFTT